MLCVTMSLWHQVRRGAYLPGHDAAIEVVLIPGVDDRTESFTAPPCKLCKRLVCGLWGQLLISLQPPPLWYGLTVIGGGAIRCSKADRLVTTGPVITGKRTTVMAVKATQQTDTDIATPENAEAASGADAAQQAIKTLMRLGKERGYVTHDELNAALPEGDYTSEQIDDYMSKLSEMGVNVVEAADTEGTAEGEDEEARVSGNVSDSDVSGTDDPVRMYLREMGSVELNDDDDDNANVNQEKNDGLKNKL